MNPAGTRWIGRVGVLLVGYGFVLGCAHSRSGVAPLRLAAPWSLEAPAWGPRGHLQSAEIAECSGMVRGRLYPDVFWVHNDSDDDARIFAIGRAGELRGEVRVQGASHVDWEDITADDAGNLYVCDVGNNRSERQDLAVYVIPEPDPGRDSTVAVTRVLPLRYPEQTGFPDPTRNFDCEAVFWREGKLYFLTKHRSDARTCLYRMDDLASEAQHDLVLEETVEVGSMVTGADLSRDGKELAVLCYGYLYLFEILEGRPLLTGGRAWRLPFEARQSESIAHDETVFWIINEQSEIHLIDRSALLRASATRRPGATEPFIAPADVPEALAWGYRPHRARLELSEGESVLVPVRPARGEDGEPAPATFDSLQASLVYLGSRLRLDLRWPAPSLTEDGAPIAYVAWGPRSDRSRLDPMVGDRSVQLVVRDGRVVAEALAGPGADLHVSLWPRQADGLVSGSVQVPLEHLPTVALDLILLARGGGEWSWGGEWSMRAPLKPWLWGTIALPATGG